MFTFWEGRPNGSSPRTKRICTSWPPPCAGIWRVSRAWKRSGPRTEARNTPGNTPGNHMTRILLVEDNEMNRDMLSRRLVRNGYEVSLAIDGQQGADMA